MGANFDSFNVRAESGADAVKACYDHIDECKWESGHGGYSGTMAECRGVQMTQQVFSSGDDAAEWLDENAEKWGPALGVGVWDENDVFEYYMFGACCSS